MALLEADNPHIMMVAKSEAPGVPINAQYTHACTLFSVWEPALNASDGSRVDLRRDICYFTVVSRFARGNKAIVCSSYTLRRLATPQTDVHVDRGCGAPCRNLSTSSLLTMSRLSFIILTNIWFYRLGMVSKGLDIFSQWNLDQKRWNIAFNFLS